MGARARSGRMLQVSVFAVLVSALLLHAFEAPKHLFWTRNVPSTSMMPTIYDGDYVLGFGRGDATAPVQRGDIVVFSLPKDPATDFIKRVVGLPGDRVQMIDGLLHINGQPVQRERLANVADDSPGSARAFTRWRETLPNGATYQTIDFVEHGFFANTPVFTVPAGNYFMLGDNRDNSTDSRVMSAVGYIPAANIVGRAGIVYFSIDHSAPSGLRSVRWSRLFTIVR
jgi:signal peptidase I